VPALILPVKLFLAQVAISWLAHPSSLLFFLQCFFILACAMFPIKGELAILRWWLHLQRLAVHRALQLLLPWFSMVLVDLG
jgi:hypothetical protein